MYRLCTMNGTQYLLTSVPLDTINTGTTYWNIILLETPPEASSKRNNPFGVSNFASKGKPDSPSGYTLPLVSHLHRPNKWFFLE